MGFSSYRQIINIRKNFQMFLKVLKVYKEKLNGVYIIIILLKN